MLYRVIDQNPDGMEKKWWINITVIVVYVWKAVISTACASKYTSSEKQVKMIH